MFQSFFSRFWHYFVLFFNEENHVFFLLHHNSHWWLVLAIANYIHHSIQLLVFCVYHSKKAIARNFHQKTWWKMFPINAGIRFFFFPSNHDYFWVLAEQQQSCCTMFSIHYKSLSLGVCVFCLFRVFFVRYLFSGHIFPSGYDILFPELLFFFSFADDVDVDNDNVDDDITLEIGYFFCFWFIVLMNCSLK